MGLLGKLFGQRAQAAKVAAKKFEKKDLMEASIGALVLLAYADGEFEESEKNALQAIVASNPSFEHFQSEIGTLIDRFCGLMAAGKTLGRVKILKEIADLKSSSEEERSEVLACAVDMAMADGELEAPEQKVLEEIARTLGLSLKAFTG